MLSEVDFITELVAVERLRQAMAGRRDVPTVERLEYRRRRAQLLREVANRTGSPADRRLAKSAGEAVDELLVGVE